MLREITAHLITFSCYKFLVALYFHTLLGILLHLLQQQQIWKCLFQCSSVCNKIWKITLSTNFILVVYLSLYRAIFSYIWIGRSELHLCASFYFYFRIYRWPSKVYKFVSFGHFQFSIHRHSFYWKKKMLKI